MNDPKYLKELGFSEHVIVGVIDKIKAAQVRDHFVVNVRVAVTPWAKSGVLRQTTFYDTRLWDVHGRVFWDLGLEAGDKVLMRLENIKVKVYFDESNYPRPSIEASVDKFLDLRSDKVMRKDKGQDQKSIESEDEDKKKDDSPLSPPW
jgi:hypothetical protein